MTEIEHTAGGTASEPIDATDMRLVALADIGVAPENMRRGQDADTDIPELAATIAAAGLLYPLLVRVGRKGEKPMMALDGRRRLLAFATLVESGAIGADHQVRVEVVADKGRQAAAVVVANTQRAPVHVADVIVAIGKLKSAKMTPARIAAALGYAELEIRRLQCLAELPRKATDALRAGKITLAVAKLISQVRDEAVRDGFVEQAASGYLQAYTVKAHLDARPSVEDPMFRLVGMDRYVAAGGRVYADLFQQSSDVLLNPDALQGAWRERVEFLVDAVKGRGLKVFYCSAHLYRAPDGFETAVASRTSSEATDAFSKLVVTASAIEKKLSELELYLPENDGDLTAYLDARLEALLATYGARVGAIGIHPHEETGFEIQAFLTRVEIARQDAAPDDEAEHDASIAGRAFTEDRYRPDVAVPVQTVDVEGRNHGLHETYTDVATRGLIRTVADDPMVALTITVARMFVLLALQGPVATDGSASTLQGRRYARTGSSPISALDGVVRERLEARRMAYKASGLRPIPWVDGLPHGEKMELLAELIAISLDLRESNNRMIRLAARAEAAEIAELTEHDISAYWTPDVGFLERHTKAQLLGALETMGADAVLARAMKKDELVGYVATTAAEKGWAPAALNLRREMAVIEDGGPEPETVVPIPLADTGNDDGVTAEVGPLQDEDDEEALAAAA